MAIQQTLKSIGLADKEIQLYLLLLKNGKMKPSALATGSKINRASVYNICRQLEAKGLITKDATSKATFFVPLPPDNLNQLLGEVKREVKEKEELIKKAVSELSVSLADKQYEVPKIRFVGEPEVEKYLFDNLTKWQDAVIDSDGVWWGYQDHTFVENFRKWIIATWQTKQSKQKNYRAQVFSNTSNIENILGRKYSRSKRDVRFISNTNFTTTMWVCGDYLVMIFTNQHPFYIIEIYNSALAENTRQIFKKLWSVTK